MQNNRLYNTRLTKLTESKTSSCDDAWWTKKRRGSVSRRFAQIRCSCFVWDSWSVTVTPTTVISKRLCRSFDCYDTAGLPPPPFWRQLLINHVTKYRGVDILGYSDMVNLKCSLVICTLIFFTICVIGYCKFSTCHQHRLIFRYENSDSVFAFLD